MKRNNVIKNPVKFYSKIRGNFKAQSRSSRRSTTSTAPSATRTSSPPSASSAARSGYSCVVVVCHVNFVVIGHGLLKKFLPIDAFFALQVIS